MRKKSLKKRNHQVIGVYCILVLVAIIYYTFIMKFVPAKGAAHFIDLTRQAAPLALVALGQTMVMLMGGIDLSVGALISTVNIMCAVLMKNSTDKIVYTIITCLLFSMLVGLINGLIIVKIKMPPFLVTLAMASILQGCYMIYTGGVAKGKIAKSFRVIASGWIGPSWEYSNGGVFPIAAIIWIVLFLALAFVSYKTTFGRQLYATGGNEQASWLSGIPTTRIKVGAYVISGLFAGLCGLMVSGYIGAADIGVGSNYEMDSIAAACIGGTTFAGGIGGVSGTVAGVMIIQIFTAIITMMGIQEEGRYIMLGVVLILVLGINYLVTQRKIRK